MRIVTPACDLQVLEIDVVLKDIGREGRNLVVVEVAARAAGCEVCANLTERGHEWHHHGKCPPRGKSDRDTEDFDL